jgi:hypothetical protein
MNVYLEGISAKAVSFGRGNHLIWCLLAAALIGLAAFSAFYPRVFPSASIDLKLTRQAVGEIAQKLANQMGYKTNGKVICSTQFSPDYDGKTFLEYELGLAQANQLMKDELPIWSWRTRFCQQHQFEEFRAWISPSGKLNGFVHDIENDRPLPSISIEQAEQLARSFIEEQAGIKLAGYKIVKSAAYSHPHRTDHAFTWQDSEHDFAGARLRVQATVAGNVLNQFSYFLYVPESWERKFSTIRSYNHLLGTIAAIFYSILHYLSIFLFIWAVTTNRIRWRFSVTVALLMTAVSTLEAFNDIASVIDDYNTHDVYVGYLLQFVVQTFSGTIWQFLNNLILVGAGESVYRFCYPDKLALENLFNLNSWRSNSLIFCIFLAHVLLAIDLGWVIFYYLGGERLHFWCPLGVDNYQILSTVFPFFSAIALGVSASVAEELMYRVLALSLVQKITKNFWFANFFQAAAWGFMHSTYPQQPAYARGIELTIGGLFHGYILRRYGIIPSLISHYLFDAFLDVKPLFSSADLCLKVSALLPIVPFLVVALWGVISRVRSGVVDYKAVENGAIALSQSEDVQDAGIRSDGKTQFQYVALPNKLRISLFTLSLASLALMLPFKNYENLGRHVAVSVPRMEAIEKARQCLLAHGISIKDRREAAWLSYQLGGNDLSGGNELQYVYEKQGLQRTLELAKLNGQGYIWRVRFFRPLDPEEYEVVLDEKCKPIEFNVTRAEDAPGAKLSMETAKEKAQGYLNSEQKLYQPYQFDNVIENKRKERIDYTFTFMVPKFKVAEADFKISTSVVGDDVSGFYAGWDIPDNWLNDRNKKRVKDEILSGLRITMHVLFFIGVILWVFSVLKSARITWRSAVLCASAFGALSILQNLNYIPDVFRDYDTTSPVTSYLIREIVSYLEADFSTSFYYLVGVAFSLAAVKIYAPEFKPSTFMAFLRPVKDGKGTGERQKLWLDAILVTGAVVAMQLLIKTASAYLKARYSPDLPTEHLGTICALSNIAVPAYDLFRDALMSGVNAILFVALAAGLYKRYCKRFSAYCALVVVFCLINYSAERYWQDYLIAVVSNCLIFLLAWFGVARVIGFNPLTYFLIGMEGVLAARLSTLFDHGLPLMAPEAIFVTVLMFSPLLYLVWLSFASQSPKLQMTIDKPSNTTLS